MRGEKMVYFNKMHSFDEEDEDPFDGNSEEEHEERW